MTTQEILTAINAEIARLQQVKTLLEGSDQTTRPIRKGRRGRRGKLSAEGRARIAAAQRARWAKQKK